jgi:CO dehydrogenase/acetyl-CoA synthase beta subunit
MKLFDSIIKEVYAIKNDMAHKAVTHQTFAADQVEAWPQSNGGDIILIPDLAVEYGSPENASVSFVLWTVDSTSITDGQITLIGPDAKEASERSHPLGKVLITRVDGMDESNAVARNRQVHLSKFDVNLNGHMLKSASHYLAEWHRISKAAVNQGFSFAHLGRGLIETVKSLSFVSAAEVIFVTSCDEDVNRLYDPGRRAARMIQAMSKMVKEMNYDCAGCDFKDLCDEADELRLLRDELAKQKVKQNEGVDP